MESEVASLRQRALRMTVWCVLALGLLFLLLWPSASKQQALMGLAWGAIAAWAGFEMICRSVSNLSPSGSKSRAAGAAGYTLRYLMYALMLFLGAWMNLPAIAMLAGIAAHKASLVLISLKQRKDRT